MIVFIQQAAQGAPVTPVAERLFTGIKNTALPHCLKLIVNTAHHMYVREVVKLKVRPDVELPEETFRLKIGHEVPYFRFSGCRQRNKQDNIKRIFSH